MRGIRVNIRHVPISRTARLSVLGAGMLTALFVTATPSVVTRAATPTFPTKIQHVVVIYQENHTFDNVLGAWCNTFSPPRCNGYTGAVTMKDGAVVTPHQSPDLVPNSNHSVAGQIKAIDKGKMDGWDGVLDCTPSSGYACMAYYTPSQIPNLTALATKFAVSDRTFSMADSPSWGGHLYAVSATLDGFIGDNPVPAAGVTPGNGWGCDSKKVSTWVNPSTGQRLLEPSCIPDPSLGIPNGGAFEPSPAQYVPTIMDRLETAGRTWHFYAANSTQAKPYNWNTCASFAECLDGPQQKNVLPTANILTDAANGTLANFSLVLPGGGPTGGKSQHNGSSMLSGDNWIGKVVTALEKSPEWSSTAIFITYDDCGCFYDHVTPGVNPDGTLQGPRVPMVIVSPYAKPGYTDSTPATFASILAYTENVLSLAPLYPTGNDGRAYNFSNSFNYSQVPLTGATMVQTALPSGEVIPPPNTNDPT
jgi:phospholipase C